MFAWMAWTWQIALFLGLIASGVVLFTVLAVVRPEVPRRGILMFPTTRGDRFFVSLLGSAYLFILWMRLGGGSLLYPLGASVALAIALFIYA